MGERDGRKNEFDLPGRVRRLEEDADRCDLDREDFRDELAKLKGILVMFLVGLATAALMLAANLAVGR